MHQLHIQQIDGSTLSLSSRIFLSTLHQDIEYKLVRRDIVIWTEPDNPIRSMYLMNQLDKSTNHTMEQLNIGKELEKMMP